MITIKQDVYHDIIAHAWKDLPNEACGYLVGENNIIKQNYRLTNVDKSPTHFRFNPAEQFAVVKNVRKDGLEILANYHSHPETLARPSEEDIKLAFDPSILYFIISLAEEIPVIKAFQIIDGGVENIEIQII